MSAQTITPLLVFRIVGDQRLPFLIELDEHMTVLVDKPVNAPDQPANIHEYYPDLDTHIFDGIILSEESLENGGRKVHYKPTPLDLRVGMWTTPSVTPNPIEGTDELRAEFFAAEASMRAGGGAECTSCDLGSLIRRYRMKLFNGGYLDDVLTTP